MVPRELSGQKDLWQSGKDNSSVSADTSHLNYIPEKYDPFIDSFRTKYKRYKWMQVLTDLVILPEDQTKKGELIPTQRSEVDFLKFTGYIIRDIKFIKLDVFGPSIIDTAGEKSNPVKRIANDVHIKTSDKVIERHLLFREGDKIDPRELSDNERILRDLSFIEDARIIVSYVEGTDLYADITVVVKDRWSIGGYVEFDEVNKGKLELWDENIFGSGNEFQNNIHWNSDHKGLLGYEAVFNNHNIYGSFIDGKAVFKNIFETQVYGLSLERKFLTPSTKWAGRAAFNHTSTLRTINYSYLLETKLPVEYNLADMWVGRSLSLNRYSTIDKNRLNLILASRIYRERFFKRPFVTPNSFYEYQNKTVWLNTLGFSSQSFYRSNLIYSYGRTEDIPVGYLASLTVGPEFGQFGNRYYSGISVSGGDYVWDAGYFYAQFSEGGFFSNEKKFEQAMYQISLNYFSNLFIIKRFKFRQFINLRYTNGFRRFDYESININEDRGIRGFSQPSVYGNKKLVLNLESVTFTPYYIMGFRFTSFCFLDLARIAPENTSLKNENFYTGFGFGFRIQNERLAFPTFQLRIGFYPNLPAMELGELIQFMGEKKLDSRDFYLKYPSIIEYE